MSTRVPDGTLIPHFSAIVVAAFPTRAGFGKRCGVTSYASYNILEDDALRQGIKEFSNWPTIPQLYVDGEFVGGCDIMREMYQSGELQQLLATQKA